MSSESFKLAQDLEKAFQSIGSTMMSDDFACKLLAYVYHMGGGNEAVVHHEGLNAGIAVAQQKLNLFGGEKPNTKMLPSLQSRIREIESLDDKTPWLHEIFDRYNLNKSNKKTKHF